jgi:hypothetical protein
MTTRFNFTGNEFLNPDECEYEILGFFEDLFDERDSRYLGTRRVAELTRPLGRAGTIIHTFTENVPVQKGHREGEIIKASAKEPIRAIGIMNILCGRLKKKHEYFPREKAIL